jgi:hypothetical protein
MYSMITCNDQYRISWRLKHGVTMINDIGTNGPIDVIRLLDNMMYLMFSWP